MLKVSRGSERAAYDWWHLLDQCKRLLTADSVLLEIGASTPQRTEELAALCKHVYAVEYFAERIPGNAPDNVTYVHGDWQRLSELLPAESIDVALSSHVIEHIPDDTGALNELYSVLKHGGGAFVNTPNRKRLIRAIAEVFTGERKFPWWEHVREYIEPDLIELIGRTAFERYEIKPLVFGVHGGPLWIYTTGVPSSLRRYAHFWEVHLFKD